MERRAFNRIPTYLFVKFFCRDSLSYGIVKNLSENGMYIDTGMCLPLESNFEILIPTSNEETLNVLVKFKRLVKTAGFYDGIGVELLNPPDNYLEFVARLRAAL